MGVFATGEHDALWQQTGRAMAAALSRAPGLVTRFAPGAWRVTSDVDSWMAIWLACHGADAASLALFQEGLDDAVASGNATSVVVGEAVRDLVVPLFAGLPVLSDGADPMMWRDAGILPPNPRSYSGHVTRVDVGPDLTTVFDLIGRAFEVDQAGSRLAMAGVLDDPAMQLFTATSGTLDSVCLTWTEGHVTLIYLMATDPDRQRRGAGWAVMAHAMEVAMRDGATGFFLEASGAGEGLYRQLGYETFEMAGYWMINPPPEEK
jgi:ribosomal protein S18 acetylase RimI-like enzyme